MDVSSGGLISLAWEPRGAKGPARWERRGVQVEGEAQGHLRPGRALGTQGG